MELKRSASAQDLKEIALAIHELTNGLPVTMRSKERKGVRIENHQIIDFEYTGPILEEALSKGEIVRKTPNSGVYKGIPVVVVPLKHEGETIAAIGVVDVTYGIYSEINTIGRRRPRP